LHLLVIFAAYLSKSNFSAKALLPRQVTLMIYFCIPQV